MYIFPLTPDNRKREGVCHMLESMKQRMDNMWRRLAGWGEAAASGAVAFARCREKRRRLGYYTGLALLLTLLGVGSHAWRTRGASDAPESGEAPRAAALARIPTLAPAPFLEPMPPATPEPVRWVWPLEGEILSGYSPDAPVWSQTLAQWQTHAALDIAGSPGEAVYACRDGTVAEKWSDRLWGNVIVIEHDEGYRSTYAGLNTLEMVNEGDSVEAGQVIGSVGQSAVCEAELGWHLHFELARAGESVDFRKLSVA